MKKLWLRERDADPSCWCPWEPATTVVMELSFIGPQPPGDDVGEFWFDDGGLNILLNAAGVKAYHKWQGEA